ncbi:MAG: tetratricopeptide repeat-containing sensor histidine kinase [Bacteroidota bacterium]
MYQNTIGRYVFAPILLAIFTALPALSQDVQTDAILRKVDSLKNQISTAKGHDLYLVYFAIANELFDVDNPQAVQYAEESFELAKQIGDSAAIVKSGRQYGQLLRRVDRLDDAINIFVEVLKISERNKVVAETKRILNALALAYNYKALYDKALDLNFKSLEIREKEGDKNEISAALNNIGLVYYKMGNTEQALDFFKQAIQAKLESKTALNPEIYINAGLAVEHLGDHSEAREYVRKGYEICGDNCNDNIIAQGEFCLGLSYWNNKEFDRAQEHFQNSYKSSRKLGQGPLITDNLLHIGEVYMETHEYDSATKYLFEAEDLASASGYNQLLIYTYGRLSKLYQDKKDYENAAKYQARYIQLKDSIYSEELIRNLARVQTNYEERENIKTIAEKNQILSLTQQMVQRQREVYFFVGLVAVLSILGTFMFLRYSRALSKAKQELSVMNQTLEKRVEDRTKQLQNVNNELDNFIYKTSHDIRGPLASLKGIANVALLELKDEKAQDYLQKLDASADKLNSILTRLLIVNQINHAVLNPIKINFQELINEILVFERKKGIPPRMSITSEVDPDVLLITDRHVLRIILENLIDNAIKYHNSSERIEPFVKIRVSLSPTGVKISVIDNGIGIQERDPQKLFQMFVRASERSESGGIGLYLTKLASERLYARVDFSTTQEKYTQFTVTIPENLSIVLTQKEKEEQEMR